MSPFFIRDSPTKLLTAESIENFIQFVIMPLYYLDSGTARSIRLNAASTTKEPGKSYLSSDSNARDTEGNRNLADASCFFRNEADDSNRFQIVRNKDGLLAAAPGEYIVFHVSTHIVRDVHADPANRPT